MAPLHRVTLNLLQDAVSGDALFVEANRWATVAEFARLLTDFAAAFAKLFAVAVLALSTAIVTAAAQALFLVTATAVSIGTATAAIVVGRAVAVWATVTVVAVAHCCQELKDFIFTRFISTYQ